MPVPKVGLFGTGDRENREGPIGIVDGRSVETQFRNDVTSETDGLPRRFLDIQEKNGAVTPADASAGEPE